MKQLVPLALVGVLTSCSPAPQAGGGIGGTGQIVSVASGQITGFGSVFVSGLEYKTQGTLMIIDGKPGDQRDLKQGMVVSVNATLTEGSGPTGTRQRAATTLSYQDTLEGFVQSVDPSGSHLTVLGQTVTVTSVTVIDPSIPGGSIRNLVPGRDLVEVSGFVLGDGIIRGTFIGLKSLDAASGGPDYQVKGVVTQHQPAQHTFKIGALIVEYTDAIVQDFPEHSRGSWDGLVVDMVGTALSSGGGTAPQLRFTATRVRLDELGITDSENAVLEGFVTKVFGQDTFFFGNQQVVTNAGTVFEGGTRNDILVGVHIEVHGALVGGVMKAIRVEVEDADLKGIVTQVRAPNRFVLGTVQVLTGPETIFEGGTVADIAVGVHVEVYGLVVNGTVEATKVEFERATTLPATGSATSTADNTVS